MTRIRTSILRATCGFVGAMAAMLALHACVATTIEFPTLRNGPSASEHVGGGVDHSASTWRLQMGDVSLHAAPAPSARGQQPIAPAVRDRIEQYLTTAMLDGMGRDAWVEHRRDADYVVEVDVLVESAHQLNGYIGISLGLEVATLATGVVAGTALSSSAGARDPLPIGGVIGLLCAIPVAIVAALGPPATTVDVSYEARVSIRRVVDGVIVDTRRVRSNWRADLSPYGSGSRTSRGTGLAVAQLGDRIVTALRREIDDAPPLRPHASAPWAPTTPSIVPEIRITPNDGQPPSP